MTAVARSLTFAALRIALVAALGSWLALLFYGVSYVEHAERSNLAAAGAVVSATLDASVPAQRAARFTALQPRFAEWNVSGALFDRAGTFVAGDASIGRDGLRVSGETTPPSGRATVVVDTGTGYALLVPTRSFVTSVRTSAGLSFVFTSIAALIVAFAAHALWARPKAATAARIVAAFEAAAPDEPPVVPPADPLFGPIVEAAAASLGRASKSAGERVKAEERLRAFLADAGHELRTPLAIAMGYVGILQRDALEDPALARRIVGDVAREHERLQRLVDRILQLARLDAVAADPSASCDAVLVGREAIALVKPLDVTRTIALSGPDHLRLAVGPEDLRDALRNLLENALRYAPGATVELSLEAAGTTGIVRVRDGGPGMSAFEREHAFDRFFRGATGDGVAGSGLGLAIVRRIAERAGGSAELGAAGTPGTTVELRFPIAGAR